jgi:hypothetical protein
MRNEHATITALECRRQQKKIWNQITEQRRRELEELQNDNASLRQKLQNKTGKTSLKTTTRSLLLGACLLFYAFELSAAQFTVAWDAPAAHTHTFWVFTNATPRATGETTNTPLVGAVPLVKTDVGTNKVTSVDGLAVGSYLVTATTHSGPLHSDWPLTNIIVNIPAPPTNERLLVVEHSSSLAFTNIQEVGFFRIKIQ